MNLKSWFLSSLLTVAFSQWVLAESKGFPMDGNGCRSYIHQKGIPVNNNNYQATNCLTIPSPQADKVILIQESTKTAVTNNGNDRQIANEREDLIQYQEQEKNMRQEVDYTEDPQGYDYGADED